MKKLLAMMVVVGISPGARSKPSDDALKGFNMLFVDVMNGKTDSSSNFKKFAETEPMKAARESLRNAPQF